jgi:sodium/bile acid cotransporter 7
MKRILADIDILLPGLLLMIFLAKIFPFQEHYNRYLPMPEITFWGVVVIFILYGLKLSPRELLSDLSNWKLHLLTQSATYVIIPLLVLVLFPFFKGTTWYSFWLALFYLAALPSTVSMSVIFVAKTHGNLGGAIFNSSISGFLGMVLTPIWMSFFIKSVDGSGEFSSMVVKLVQQIFIPILIGMTLKYFAPISTTWMVTKLKNFDKFIVLLIVYNSFSNAFNRDLFSIIPLSQLMVLIAGVVALYLVVFELLGFLGRILSFKPEDMKVLLFCGTQKSLVHGSVFAVLLFQDPNMQTLALLPLMIYHAFQLFFASYKSIVWNNTALD